MCVCPYQRKKYCQAAPTLARARCENATSGNFVLAQCPLRGWCSLSFMSLPRCASVDKRKRMERTGESNFCAECYSRENTMDMNREGEGYMWCTCSVYAWSMPGLDQ